MQRGRAWGHVSGSRDECQAFSVVLRLSQRCTPRHSERDRAQVLGTPSLNASPQRSSGELATCLREIEYRSIDGEMRDASSRAFWSEHRRGRVWKAILVIDDHLPSR